MHLETLESPVEKIDRLFGKSDNFEHYKIDIFLCEKNLSNLVAYANIKFGIRWVLRFNEICYNKDTELHEVNLSHKITCMYSGSRFKTSSYFNTSFLNEIKLKILECYFKKKYGKKFELLTE